jgi:competence protein ComEC
VSINDVCAALPLAYAPSTHFSVWHCFGWYAALAVGAVVVRGRWWEGFTPRRLLIGALGLILVLSLWFAVSAYQPGELTVTFLDVGHGQCCVVEAPSGHTMMVDAGSQYSTREGQRCARDIVLPFLARRGISRLDFIVLTHPDADHCNAIAPILKEIPVGLILESFPAPDHKLYSQLAATAAHRGVAIERTFAGGQIDLGRGVSATVLWPSGTPSDEAYGDNDRSVVLLLCYGETRLLLTGDIEQAAEGELVARRAALRADFLQVPHHGAARSSTEAFLDRVRPSVAVISCGSADPDHPHPAALARYRRRGVRVLRTDLDGAVTAISNGARLTLRSHLRADRSEALSHLCVGLRDCREQGLGLLLADSARLGRKPAGHGREHLARDPRPEFRRQLEPAVQEAAYARQLVGCEAEDSCPGAWGHAFRRFGYLRRRLSGIGEGALAQLHHNGSGCQIAQPLAVLLEEGDNPSDEVEIGQEIDEAHCVANDEVEGGGWCAIVPHDPESRRPFARGLPVPPDLEDGKIEGEEKQRSADDDADSSRPHGGRAERQAEQGDGGHDEGDDEVVQQRGDHAGTGPGYFVR